MLSTAYAVDTINVSDMQLNVSNKPPNIAEGLGLGQA